jgi:hypothetical protein
MDWGQWLERVYGGDQGNVSEPYRAWNSSAATEKVSAGIVEDKRTLENIQSNHEKKQAVNASNLSVDGAEKGRSSAAAR